MQDHFQTSTALQVFNSIGRLEEVVRGRVEEKCKGVQPGLAKALSGSTEYTYNGSTPGNDTAFLLRPIFIFPR